jgi:hypothetical protein
LAGDHFIITSIWAEGGYTSHLEDMPEKLETGRSLMDHAIELENSYDWLGAAEIYGKVIESVPRQESRRIGDLHERKAYALYKAAFQSDSNPMFAERLSRSIECYGTASEWYRKGSDRGNEAIALRCDAMAEYLGFWRASDPEEKKRLVGEAWELTKKALASLRSPGDAVDFCITYNQLMSSAIELMDYMWDHEAMVPVIKELMKFGEHAVGHVTELADPRARALTYVRASLALERYAVEFVGVKEGLKIDRVSRELWDKAKALSEETTFCETVRFNDMPSPSDLQEVARMLVAAIEHGRRANDRLVIGSALDWQAQKAYYKVVEAASSDEMDAAAALSSELCKKAQKEYDVIGYYAPSVTWVWPGCPDPWVYAHQSWYSSDPKRKRAFAEKALECRPRLREVLSASGRPDAIADADLIISIALGSMAKTETDLETRKQLLGEALEMGSASGEMWERRHPVYCGPRSFNTNILADFEFELASLEKEPGRRAELLRKARARKQRAIELVLEFLEDPAVHGPGNITLGGIWHSGLGAFASSLYELTHDRKDLEEAIRAYEDSAEMFARAGQPSRCAESHWRAAQAFDVIGEHMKSSERFATASESYKLAAKELPRLKDLYEDHSLYMQAWAEIERARYNHAKQDARAAKESYEKASRLHEATERWAFLAPNYMAWAEVENGESLSRKEQSNEAVLAFGRAAKLFSETKESLKKQLGKIRNEDEREAVDKLIKAADLRREFCKGRMALEEARVLDRQGDEYGSCAKFGSAAETFERLRTNLDSDQDRLEIQFVTTLSKAWQTMAKAETDSSPELYEAASALFEQAKDLSVGERAKLLALGHSRFCRALAAGMRFADTGEASLHAVATQNLESAAKHYLKAGLANDSEYAKASKLLFDAYFYMDRASREENQEKKAKLYAMTEKVLEASASAYSKADYPKKRDQAKKLLEKVRGERELAVTLMEVLHAPDAGANTMGVVGPTLETAAGLERFEHANVQAVLIARPKESFVGESVNLEIELVNAGRAAAQLTKVEEAVPRGFDLKEVPGECKLEEGCLNMRGRRLDPLKTHDVRLVLKPTVKGRFRLTPRIMYLDESGKYKSCEPEPVEITVKELGISGWIKGQERKG